MVFTFRALVIKVLLGGHQMCAGLGDLSTVFSAIAVNVVDQICCDRDMGSAEIERMMFYARRSMY